MQLKTDKHLGPAPRCFSMPLNEGDQAHVPKSKIPPEAGHIACPTTLEKVGQLSLPRLPCASMYLP